MVAGNGNGGGGITADRWTRHAWTTSWLCRPAPPPSRRLGSRARLPMGRRSRQGAAMEARRMVEMDALPSPALPASASAAAAARFRLAGERGPLSRLRARGPAG
ncbi:hypothetical protein RJ55_00868 [Drechmeria coniospora]|nr:hypothetical protein RJ55_00868 [Drechmeria coniospora]